MSYILAAVASAALILASLAISDRVNGAINRRKGGAHGGLPGILSGENRDDENVGGEDAIAGLMGFSPNAAAMQRAVALNGAQDKFAAGEDKRFD